MGRMRSDATMKRASSFLRRQGGPEPTEPWASQFYMGSQNESISSSAVQASERNLSTCSWPQGRDSTWSASECKRHRANRR